MPQDRPLSLHNMKIGQLFDMMKDMRPEIKKYDMEANQAYELESLKE